VWIKKHDEIVRNTTFTLKPIFIWNYAWLYLTVRYIGRMNIATRSSSAIFSATPFQELCGITFVSGTTSIVCVLLAYLHAVIIIIIRSTPPSRLNNIRGGLKCPSVRTSVRTSVRPSVHKRFFRFQWNLVCRYGSISDAQRYAVWPDPRSRSRSRGFWTSEHCTFLGLSPPPFTVGDGKWPLIFKLQHNI